ncbi:hypothetical protein [Aquisalibacillus elongatus]|uniref:Uncharacterized protein n=1 Tax=Aquisalibacillus elongatus TaxID=485577 RepID=A0A3N5BCX1_9BACI|nr:hypothetical protein [Aquisalibacillus elongatus]RPF55287.1 hypothetical protein EDC24_0158 [Aquisalibacillus elongatus]
MKKPFILFSMAVGFVVGLFSVISDHIPYMVQDVTKFEMIIFYLAVMINSLPFWFMMAMFVGYWFGRELKEALLLGGLYTVVAITFYFVIGAYYNHVIVQEVPPVSVSWVGQIKTYAIWYGASIVGGSLGGGLGHLIKWSPYALLLLVVGLILQLNVNGASSWGNVIGIAQNVSFCIIVVSIFIYLGVMNKRGSQ